MFEHPWCMLELYLGMCGPHAKLFILENNLGECLKQ